VLVLQQSTGAETSRQAQAPTVPAEQLAAGPVVGATEPGAPAAVDQPPSDTRASAAKEVAKAVEPPTETDLADATIIEVTVRSSPPGAMLFHDDRQIGSGRATLTMQRGEKAKLLALLNDHEPTRLTIDGSRSEVVIVLAPKVKANSTEGSNGAVAAAPPESKTGRPESRVVQRPAPEPAAVGDGAGTAAPDSGVSEVPVGKATPPSERDFFRRMNDL
jgi:hypothetical protein